MNLLDVAVDRPLARRLVAASLRPVVLNRGVRPSIQPKTGPSLQCEIEAPSMSVQGQNAKYS
jgi:hypothetical protein